MAEELDESDLDEEELAALKEVSKKGYYHARPKSEPQSYSPEAINGAEGSTDTGRHSDHDAFQQKWDKFDGDEDALAAGLKEKAGTGTDQGDWPEPEVKPKLTKEERIKKKARLEKAMKKSQDAEFKTRCLSCACLLFMFAGGALGFMATIWSAVMGNGIVRLDVNNIAEVKDVLFGGEPWLIYCVDEQTKTYPLPPVLESSAWDLRSSIGVKVGVLDCFQTLDSGRSIAQKFGYGNNPGMAFAIANGEKPRVVSVMGTSSEELERKIKPILPVEIAKISEVKKWPKCSGRRACVIIGHKTDDGRDTAMNVFKPLLEQHRGVKVVTLDTSFWALKLGDKMLKNLKERPQKQKSDQSLEVLCLARPEGHMDRSPTESHSGSFLPDALTAGSASTFLTACAKHEGLVVWGVEPKISVKSKKPKKASTPSPPTKNKESEASPNRKESAKTREEVPEDEPVAEEEDDERVEL